MVPRSSLISCRLPRRRSVAIAPEGCLGSVARQRHLLRRCTGAPAGAVIGRPQDARATAADGPRRPRAPHRGGTALAVEPELAALALRRRPADREQAQWTLGFPD